MRRLHDLNTATKLALSFGLMALIIGFVGFEGVRGMAGFRENMAALYEQGAMGVSHIKQANVSVFATQAGVRAALLEEDPKAAVKWKTEARKLEAEFKTEFDLYKKTLTSAGEIAKATQAEKLFKELREVQDSLFDLVGAGAGAQARGMWANLDPLVDAVNLALSELSEKKVAAMQQTAEQTWASYAARRSIVVGVVLAAIVVALALGIVIARMISRPLGRAVEVLETVAAGDLTERLAVTSRDEVGRMAAALNRALDSMSGVLVEVSEAAARTAVASRQVSAAAERMASGAQEQASSLEETAASLEEITGTLKQTADNARQASDLAVGSRNVAEKGGQIVATAVQAMAEINTSSRKIADIITTIDEIAFQTNLLALNAAVEAARAGDQGRGFAVVAAEVRNLAQRSAGAAKEIKGLIQDSVAKVDSGSALVNRSGDTLTEIVTSAKRVTDIVAEIAAASQEQSTGIDQVNRAVTQVDQVTQGNAAQTEEMTTTAEALATQAAELQTLVARFKLAHRGERRAVPAVTPPESGGPMPRPRITRAPAAPRELALSAAGFEEI